MEHINSKTTLKESKLITSQIIKKIFKNYKTTPHIPTSEEEANDNITDLVMIQEIIQRIITRRNNSLS
jgi:hypothetical protein